MKFLIKLVISTVSVLLVDFLLDGITIEPWQIAIIVAVLLSLLNATLKPVLVVVTIPVTIFTLGLFMIVINALIVLLVDWLVPGFAVNGFWWAVLFSLILSLINSFLETSVFGEKKSER